MKERPIIFSAPMVRALLAGTKTQTRRVAKVEQTMGHQSILGPRNGKYGHVYLLNKEHDMRDIANACPYGQPGDRLWVREAWQHTEGGAVYDAAGGVADSFDPDTVYRASRPHYPGPWKPSIHMPRWASRITLEIVSVRIERLQDITEEDATAEGVAEFARGSCATGNPTGLTYVGYYAKLWESINGADSWDLNPLVWAIKFKRVAA